LIYKIHFAYPHEFIDPETATLVEFEKYPFPLHNDEWAHLAAGITIAEEGKFNYNPYLDTPAQDREIGFHAVLAGIFLLPGINPVNAYQFFAPLFLVINALVLFFLVYKLTKNYWIGLFSILFFAAIKSNLNFMGNWFFTPATFSLFIIFLFFYLFVKSLETNKINWIFFGLSMLLFLVAIIVYPLASVIIAVIAVIYALTKFKLLKKNWKYILPAFIIGIIIVLVFVKLYFWTGSLGGTFEKFFSELVFKKGWTALEHTYSLLKFHGIVPLILAVLGAAYLFLKKKNFIFIIWPAILLINLLLYVIFDFSLLLPYQRNLFYLLIGLAPLSAMGLYWLSERIIFYSKKYVFKKKAYSIIPAILLITIVLLFTFNHYYKIEPQKFSLHKVISQPEYESLVWLKEIHEPRESQEPYQKVLAKPFLSTTIYPISRNRVVGMIPSSLEGGVYGKIYDFFNGGCDFKKKIITEEKVDLVISSEELYCDFLGKIYYKDGVNIYSVK